MDTKAAGRGTAGEPYYYRRRLHAADRLTAAGVALGVGVLGFYVVSLFLQRTPLVPNRPGESSAGGPRRDPLGGGRTSAARRAREG